MEVSLLFYADKKDKPQFEVCLEIYILPNPFSIKLSQKLVGGFGAVGAGWVEVEWALVFLPAVLDFVDQFPACFNFVPVAEVGRVALESFKNQFFITFWPGRAVEGADGLGLDCEVVAWYFLVELEGDALFWLDVEG